MIAVRKSDAYMGAEISGVDLSGPLSDRIFGAVRDALHRHHVLVFRGQSLEPESFLHGVGDVVVWDNASVLHSATLTDPDDARTLFRITAKEEQRPIA